MSYVILNERLYPFIARFLFLFFFSSPHDAENHVHICELRHSGEFLFLFLFVCFFPLQSLSGFIYVVVVIIILLIVIFIFTDAVFVYILL